ncbi:MAG: protein kinase [Planctomycetota bacterium]
MAHPGDEPFVIASFLRRYREDQRGGVTRPVRAYCEQFPGFASRIADELAALHAEPGRARTDVAPVPGQLGRYELQEEIGRGGQGVVYRALDPQLERIVAVKVLSGLGPWSRRAVQRFRREAVAASKLEHPSICPVYDAGWHGGQPFLAMRLVDGETLAQRIADARATPGDPAPGRRSRSELLWFFERAARALQHAHERGVLHRDVKPGNLMIARDGTPVLLDFGLALEAGAERVTRTGSGETPGTLPYMAPEQIDGGPAEPRTDLWGLAVSLYEALTLQRPFGGPTPRAIERAILTQPVAAPSRHGLRLDRALTVVVQTGLAKDPRHRYANCAALADDLAAAREGRPIAARPRPWPAQVLSWVRRRPRAALAAALGLGLAATAGFLAAHADAIAEHRRRVAFTHREGQLGRGWAALHGGDAGSAKAVFEDLLATTPDCLEAVGGMVGATLRAEGATAALGVLDRHRHLTTAHPVLEHLRRRLQRQAGAVAPAGSHPADLPAVTGSPDLFVGASLGFLIGPESTEDAHRLRDWIEQAVLENPRAPRLLYHEELAVAAMFSRDRAVGARVARALAALWPDQTYAWSARSFALWFDPAAAVASCDRGIALWADNPFAWSQKGVHLLSAGTADKALDAATAFGRAAALQPTSAYFARGLALALARASACDSSLLPHALQRCERACAVAPKSPWAWLTLAEVHRRRGDRVATDAAIQRAEAAGGAAATVSRLRAELARDAGDVPGAVAWLRQALRQDTTAVPRTIADRSWADLGAWLVDQGQMTTARELLDGAAAAWPFAPRLATARGRAHMTAGDAAAAVAAARDFLSRGITDPLVRAGLAKALSQRGDEAAATTIADEARADARRMHALGWREAHVDAALR